MSGHVSFARSEIALASCVAHAMSRIDFRAPERRLNIRGRGVRGRALVATLITSFWAWCCSAQTPAPAAPVYSASDLNDVDFTSGSPYFRVADLSIGASPNNLTHVRSSTGPRSPVSGLDSFLGILYVDQSQPVWINNSPRDAYIVVWGGQSEKFYLDNGAFVSAQQRGSTLVAAGNGTWTYTIGDGSAFTLDPGPLSTLPPQSPCASALGLVTQVRDPDARVLRIYYASNTCTVAGFGSSSIRSMLIRSVVRSDGLQLKYSYSPIGVLTSVMAINNAYEYCDPTAETCSLTRPWPTATYSSSGNVSTITDADGRVTRFTSDGQARVTNVRWPTSGGADNVSYFYCNDSCFAGAPFNTVTFPDMVTHIVRGDGTWTYSFAPGGGFSFSTFRSTSPAGAFKQASLAATFAPQTTFVSPMVSMSNEEGMLVHWNPTSHTGRVTNVFSTEGNVTYYTYDARGNLTQTMTHPKSGSGEPSLIVTADYDATCTNPVKCNKPNWVRDARGNQTDFVYHGTNGGVFIETPPAGLNGIRPEKRYGYTQRYAWVKNAAGAYVPSQDPIWVLTSEKHCTKSASTGWGCMASDEVITNYEYGPDSGPNNLFLRGVAVSSASQTLRTCYSYDERGNRISETRPRAALTSCP